MRGKTAVCLCYFDESGDSQHKRCPTGAFALAGVIASDGAWLPLLNVIMSFRRYLRNSLGLRMRGESKEAVANGLWVKLPPQNRRRGGRSSRVERK